MSRYIDADKAMEIWEDDNYILMSSQKAKMKILLDAVPSADVVEVVRCKDCKYLKPFASQYGAGQFCECPCSFGGQGIKKPNDYCSYGERKYDDECK